MNLLCVQISLTLFFSISLSTKTSSAKRTGHIAAVNALTPHRKQAATPGSTFFSLAITGRLLVFGWPGIFFRCHCSANRTKSATARIVRTVFELRTVSAVCLQAASCNG